MDTARIARQDAVGVSCETALARGVDELARVAFRDRACVDFEVRVRLRGFDGTDRACVYRSVRGLRTAREFENAELALDERASGGETESVRGGCYVRVSWACAFARRGVYRVWQRYAALGIRARRARVLRGRARRALGTAYKVGREKV